MNCAGADRGGVGDIHCSNVADAEADELRRG
jgi:hypothetical protein